MKNILDRRTLRQMAGARSFERGEDYFASGQVRALAEHDGTITARILGTREYRVKLWVEKGNIEFSCTCPVGTDGAFCKHCVAVGLAWLEQGSESATTAKKPAKPAVTMDGVHAYLAGHDRQALVDMLMEQAMNDERLRQRLFMKAAKKTPKTSPPTGRRSTTPWTPADSLTTARPTTTHRASRTPSTRSRNC